MNKRYGCHLDIDAESDECVLDYGRPQDCEYWRPIDPKDPE